MLKQIDWGKRNYRSNLFKEPYLTDFPNQCL